MCKMAEFEEIKTPSITKKKTGSKSFNLGKFVKENKSVLMIAVGGAVGVFALLQSRSSSSQDSTDYEYTTGTSYDTGYPSGGSSSGNTSSSDNTSDIISNVIDVMNQYNDNMNDRLNQYQGNVNNSLSSMNDKLSNMTDKINEKQTDSTISKGQINGNSLQGGIIKFPIVKRPTSSLSDDKFQSISNSSTGILDRSIMRSQLDFPSKNLSLTNPIKTQPLTPSPMVGTPSQKLGTPTKTTSSGGLTKGTGTPVKSTTTTSKTTPKTTTSKTTTTPKTTTSKTTTTPKTTTTQKTTTTKTSATKGGVVNELKGGKWVTEK